MANNDNDGAPAPTACQRCTQKQYTNCDYPHRRPCINCHGQVSRTGNPITCIAAGTTPWGGYGDGSKSGKRCKRCGRGGHYIAVFPALPGSIQQEASTRGRGGHQGGHRGGGHRGGHRGGSQAPPPPPPPAPPPPPQQDSAASADMKATSAAITQTMDRSAATQIAPAASGQGTKRRASDDAQQRPPKQQRNDFAQPPQGQTGQYGSAPSSFTQRGGLVGRLGAQPVSGRGGIQRGRAYAITGGRGGRNSGFASLNPFPQGPTSQDFNGITALEDEEHVPQNTAAWESQGRTRPAADDGIDQRPIKKERDASTEPEDGQTGYYNFTPSSFTDQRQAQSTPVLGQSSNAKSVEVGGRGAAGHNVHDPYGSQAPPAVERGDTGLDGHPLRAQSNDTLAHAVPVQPAWVPNAPGSDPPIQQGPPATDCSQGEFLGSSFPPQRQHDGPPDLHRHVGAGSFRQSGEQTMQHPSQERHHLEARETQDNRLQREQTRLLAQVQAASEQLREVQAQRQALRSQQPSQDDHHLEAFEMQDNSLQQEEMRLQAQLQASSEQLGEVQAQRQALCRQRRQR